MRWASSYSLHPLHPRPCPDSPGQSRRSLRQRGKMAEWQVRAAGEESPLPDIGTEGLQVEKIFQIKVLRRLPWISITELTSA